MSEGEHCLLTTRNDLCPQGLVGSPAHTGSPWNSTLCASGGGSRIGSQKKGTKQIWWKIGVKAQGLLPKAAYLNLGLRSDRSSCRGLFRKWLGVCIRDSDNSLSACPQDLEQPRRLCLGGLRAATVWMGVPKLVTLPGQIRRVYLALLMPGAGAVGRYPQSLALLMPGARWGGTKLGGCCTQDERLLWVLAVGVGASFMFSFMKFVNSHFTESKCS